MTWMTLDQFFAALEKPKCSHCDKKATYFPISKTFGNIYYCDDHYPFKLSDETPSSNSASLAFDQPKQH